MSYEIRHRGRRVEAFETEAEATAWIAHPDRIVGWTVTPEKAFRVSCRGVLVETFDTTEEAEAFVTERLASPPRLFRVQRSGARAIPGLAGPPTRNDWTIEKRDATTGRDRLPLSPLRRPARAG